MCKLFLKGATFMKYAFNKGSLITEGCFTTE